MATGNSPGQGEPVDSQVSVSERAIKDTAKQYGSQLAVGLFAVFFGAWLNRLLPAKELALWPLCISIGGGVSSLSSFGLGDTFIRRIPALLARGEQKEATRLLTTGLGVNLLACVALSLVVYLLASDVAHYMLHDSAQLSQVQGIALAAFFIALSERLNWAMQAVQLFGRRALVNAISGIIRTPLALGLCLLLNSGTGVIYALTFTPLLTCVLSLIWLWPHLRIREGLTWPWQTLRFSVPYYGVSLVSLVCGRLNQPIIALFVRPEILATYFVASSIAGYVDSLDRFAIDAVTPKLSEKGALAESVVETESIFTKCTRYIFLGLTPLHVLVAIAATPLMQLYGGPQYAGAGLLLVVLCLALLVRVIGDLQRAHVTVLAQPLHLFALSVVNSISNIGFLVVLVPLLGALGAALVDALVAVVLLIASALLLKLTLRLRYDWNALAIAGTATLAAAGVLWLAHPLWAEHASSVLPVLLVASFVYALLLARRLTRHDVRLCIKCLPAGLRDTRFGEALIRTLSWLWTKPDRPMRVGAGQATRT